MTITKAVDRFRWRFQNGWKANKNDIDAFNTIANFVNDKHKNQIKNYELFAKLYIYVYGQFLKHYKADVSDKIPEKELHKMLDRPIDQFIEDFKDYLNTFELLNTVEVLGLCTKDQAIMTTEDKKKDADILRALDKGVLESISKDVWDFEAVKENLTRQINLVIDEYGN